MQITAAVATGPHVPMELATVELQAPRPDEVLVEIKGVGLCHTDIGARDGIYGLPYPVVLGHEGSGIVTEVGERVTNLAPGDHVALSFSSCGTCTSCSRGNPAYCRNFTAENYIGTRPDGSTLMSRGGDAVHSHFFGQSSFASHAVTKARNVVKVDDDLDIAMIGPLGCGLQTGAGAVMQSMSCRQGSSLLVLGAGPVGLAAVMGAVIQKCAKVIVVEPHESRRDLALSIGATHAIDPTSESIKDAVLAVAGEGVDYVFDTTGRVDVIQQGIDSVASNAVLGLVGVPSDFSVNLPLNIVATMQTGLTIKGIVEGDSDPQTFIPRLLEHHRAGEFPFDKLIKRFPFSELNEAIEAQHRGEAVKVVVVPDNNS
ncbi:NAD(P)-dependent alcohol dehydrogenase [Nocardioides sp. YJ-D4]